MTSTVTTERSKAAGSLRQSSRAALLEKLEEGTSVVTRFGAEHPGDTETQQLADIAQLRHRVPRSVSAVAHAPIETAHQAEVTSGNFFILQVAALKETANLDILTARLTDLGFKPIVQPATIKGEHFYRVRLGPYGSRAQLQRDRERLESNGYPAVLIRQW